MKLSTSPQNTVGVMFGVFTRLMKSAAVIAPVLMLSVAGSSAQEISPKHIEAAKSAIDASKATVPLDGILPNISIRAKSTLIATRPDIADTISEIVDNVAIGLAARRGDLENEIAGIYARIFTEEQLSEIAKFYSSDVGKKLLAEAPIIERQIQESSQTWGAGIQRDLNQSVTKQLKELDIKPSE